MEGVIKNLYGDRKFGFIEQTNDNKTLWFFHFHDRDIDKSRAMFKEGAKVRFEAKESSDGFKEKLNRGELKDADFRSHRNPVAAQNRVAPAAHKVEIIVEQVS
jgi:cold shock CspA family protein